MDSQTLKRKRFGSIDIETTADTQHASLGSCDACKKRKVRCDRTKPCCNSCAKNSEYIHQGALDIECLYRQKQKPGLKAGYGKDLMERMEWFHYTITGCDGVAFKQIQQQRLCGLIIGLELCMTDLTLLLEFLESQTVINGEALQKVSESIVSLTETLNRLIEGKSAPPSKPSPISSVSSDLLDKKLISELVDIYFNTLHPSFPVLNPMCKQDIKVARKGSPEVLLQYAIVCSTLRYLPPDRLTSNQSLEIYKQCKNEIILKSFEIRDVETLCALAVLAVDLIGCSNGPETWSILPLITSAVLHLGLHKEDAQESANNDNQSALNGEHSSQDYLTSQSASILPQPQSWHEQEARRRLFWGIYMLDRYSAISTAFSFKIPSKEVDRYFPVIYSKWIAGTQPSVMCKALKKTSTENRAEMLDEFGHLIDILQLLSEIHEFLKTPVSVHSLKGVIDWQVKCRQLDMELENWFNSLPYEYQDISHRTPPPMLLMLHATYQTSVIRLNSSAGYSQLQSEYFSVSLTASKNCIKAGQVMSDIARVTLEMGIWKQLGPHFAWCIWVTARLLLVDCITLNKPLPEELDVLLAVLEVMGQFWPIASRYHALLVMVCEEQLALTNKKEMNLANNHEEVLVKSSSSGDKMLTSSDIISDMNRNAYALDFILLKDKPGQQSIGNQDQEHEKSGPEQVTQNRVRPENRFSGNGLSDDGRTAESNDVDIFEWFNWPKKLDLSPENSDIQRIDSTESFKKSLASGDIGGLIERSIGKEDWLSPEAKKKHAEKTGV